MVFAAAALLFQLSAVIPRNSPGSATKSGLGSMSTAKSYATHLSSDDTPADHGTHDSSSLKSVAVNAAPDFQSFSTIRIPGPNHDKQVAFHSAESYPRRTGLLLLLAQHGAAGFDAYATRYAVGHGALEEDPLMRPFARSPSIYFVSQVAPTVLDLVGRRMSRSPNDFIRRMWWVPESVSTGAYLFSGAHDLRVGSQRYKQ